MTLRRVFIANRGEIAVRIVRACHAAGLEAVVAVSAADRDTLAARLADRAICIGPASSSASYLDIEAVVAAAIGAGCDGLHPGYGFLAENATLAEICADAGLTFIGPAPAVIRDLGNKINARAIAKAAGVPVVPGRDGIASRADAAEAAGEVGFPILLKAASGGGGRGMQVVTAMKDLSTAFETATAEAHAAFGDGTLYMERFVGNARHVEVQVLGDRHGTVVHLGERDCTLQRRHQKIVEEGPATCVPAHLVEGMREAAVALARSVGYESAGTVEFIVDQDRQEFFFLEVNTRIQVEHPVTEMLTGVDLVGEQLSVAAGKPLCVTQDDIRLTGHAIECRINAEAALENFRPSPGRITDWQPPQGDGIRLDSHCFAGYIVPPFYDSLMAKLIVTGRDRDDALDRMRAALAEFRVEGVETTLPFLRALVARPEFRAGAVDTRWVEGIMTDPDFLEPHHV